MDKKFEILSEKFKAAESIRKEKVNELEMEANIAWKFRESRKMISQKKKILENKIQVEMLKLKIKKGLLSKQKNSPRVEANKAQNKPFTLFEKQKQKFH